MSLEKEKKQNSPEISEQEETIKNYQEEIDDLNDDLPITKQEAEDSSDALQEWYEIAEKNPEEARNALESYMDEFTKFTRPLETLALWFANGMRNAINKGNLKLNKKDMDEYHPEALLIKVLEKAGKENINLIEKDNETEQYFINPDWLFNAVNKLEKKDRKFIKKVLKAISKTRDQEAKDEAKRSKKFRWKIIDKID